MSIVSRLCSLKNCYKLKHIASCGNIHLKRNECVFTSQTRSKSIFGRLFKKVATEEEFRIKDNIADGYNLIYRNAMHNYLLSAQIATTTSFVMLGIIVVMSSSNEMNFEADFSALKSSPASVDHEVLVYLTALSVFVVLLQYMLHRVPVRIYNYPKKERYAFVYYGTLPFSTKRAFCGLDQIKKMPSDSNPIIPWYDDRYEVHNNSGVILFPNFFKTPSELNIMLGYQKRCDEKEDEE